MPQRYGPYVHPLRANNDVAYVRPCVVLSPPAVPCQLNNGNDRRSLVVMLQRRMRPC